MSDTVALPADLTPLLLTGHVVDVLRSLPEASVHCVVTSPPYWGLRAYGTDPQVWGGDPEHAHEWAETKPRRARSESDATSAIEEASVGGRNYEAQGGERCEGCGAWRGELGLEPTPGLFVSHLADVFDEVRRVLRDDGTLWLNLGDTYAGGSPVRSDAKRKLQRASDEDYIPFGQPGNEARPPCGIRPKNLVGIPWRAAFELQRRGWWLRSDCVWAKPNPMPESVTDRPTRSHEYVFLLTKSERYFYDGDAVRTKYSAATMPEIGEKYTGMATKAFREYRAQDASEAKRSMIRSLERHGGANLKSVWWIATQPYPEAHFATFPEILPETCLKLGSPPGAVVLDPFAGSGTTLAVARRLGRRSIGIELKPEYVALARRRCAADVPDLASFVEAGEPEPESEASPRAP